MRLSITHRFLPKHPSTAASQVMDHFGIGFEQAEHVIARDFDVPIRDGNVVLFTGASGSGKSSLMRECARQLALGEADAGNICHEIIFLDDLELGDRILIEALKLPVDEAIRLLGTCGLGEAQLMLRTPAELSDGQRYRFRLALALASKPRWIVADEFTATLDRTLAKVVAYNIRRTASNTGTGFLLATTHEDIALDLDPDVHVHCRLDGAHFAAQRDDPSDESAQTSGKKKVCRSPATCGFPVRPSATGHISLGGITAATTSG